MIFSNPKAFLKFLKFDQVISSPKVAQIVSHASYILFKVREETHMDQNTDEGRKSSILAQINPPTSYISLKSKEEINMDQNTDEGRTSSILATNPIPKVIKIFGALGVTDMVIER